MSVQSNNYRVLAAWRKIRFGLVVVGVVCCFCGIWVAARVGSASLYVHRSKSADAPLPLADRAVQLNPFDPEAHRQRAWALRKSERLTDCAEEHARAVAMRPRDYFLWLELGHARDRYHDAEGAVAAFKEAARLAPRYAQTRWYLGYGLLRAEQNDEGFAELRLAVEINPALLTKFFDLAAEVYDGDPSSIQRRVSPQTDRVRLALSRYFAQHGNILEAIDLFRAVQVVPDSERRGLVQILLDGKHFVAAYQVWSGGRAPDQTSGVANLLNGGFENPLSLDEIGFGWQVPREPKEALISVDEHEVYAGARSLHVEFTGASTPSVKIISQFVLIEPHVRYRLTFSARTKELATLGLPFLSVTDASDKDLRSLARSPSLLLGTSAWQDYSVEFVSPDSAEAVSISFLREDCPDGACAAFGHVWLDNFSLHKL